MSWEVSMIKNNDRQGVPALRASRPQIPSPTAREKSTPSFFNIDFRSPQLPLEPLASAFESVADLLSSGISLPKALQLTEDQIPHRQTKSYFRTLYGQVRSGSSLHAAIKSAGTSIPSFIIPMVQLGEAQGSLDQQMQKIVEMLTKTLQTKRMVITQSLYPIGLLLLLILTFLFLTYVVLPQFEVLFLSNDLNPPPETLFVLAAGQMIRQNMALFPLLLILFLLTFQFLRRSQSDTFSRFIAKMPGLNRFQRERETGRFCRSLGLLLQGSMPLSSAIPYAIDSVRSAHYKSQFATILKQVRAGGTFSQALIESNTTSHLTEQLVQVGEQSGRLGEMLLKVADRADDRSERLLKRATSLLSPILTALIGFITAGVIAAVLTGVMGLNEVVYE